MPTVRELLANGEHTLPLLLRHVTWVRPEVYMICESYGSNSNWPVRGTQIRSFRREDEQIYSSAWRDDDSWEIYTGPLFNGHGANLSPVLGPPKPPAYRLRGFRFTSL